MSVHGIAYRKWQNDGWSPFKWIVEKCMKKGHSCQISNEGMHWMKVRNAWKTFQCFLFRQQDAAFYSVQLIRKNSHPINRKVLRAKKESPLLKGRASVCIKGRRTAAANQKGRKQSNVRGVRTRDIHDKLQMKVWMHWMKVRKTWKTFQCFIFCQKDVAFSSTVDTQELTPNK